MLDYWPVITVFFLLLAGIFVSLAWIVHNLVRSLPEEPISTRALIPAVALRLDAEVYFSPKGGCEEAINSAIRTAKREIRIMAYFFTDQQILETLLLACKRGVDVAMVTDGHVTDKPLLKEIRAAGAKQWIDKKHPIMHNKIMVIDRRTVLTGSFNFTESADKGNAENLLVLRSHYLSMKYLENWEIHRQHSIPIEASA